MAYGMTSEMELTLLVLALTTVLFVTDRLRGDVIAISVALILAWLGLVTPVQAFSGLGSNAVVAVVAVMILGRGVERAGVMIRLSRAIMRIAGSDENKLIWVVCTVVGGLSAFMQNIGSAALFLPAMLRISKSTKTPASRFLMPMGFSAILGGTLSMVGSGPLIILNDLLRQGGEEPFSLFSVTPLGLALLGAGIAYFLMFGHRVLPSRAEPGEEKEPQKDLTEIWKLPTIVSYYVIPKNSDLIGKTREEARFRVDYEVTLLAMAEGEETTYAPWRYTRFAAGQELALLGREENAKRFAADFRLRKIEGVCKCSRLLKDSRAGFAEAIVRPHSPMIRKSLREIAFRKNYGVEPIILLSGAYERRKDFADQPLQAGDTFVIHGPWECIKKLERDPNFVLLTPIEAETLEESKVLPALLCFLGAIGLALVGVQISLALLSGAVAMILLKVVPIDEAYEAVDWRVAILLAGLIPLGIAMDTSNAAQFIAQEMTEALKESPEVLILGAVALLSTILSLFMSNVAATVLLVPLVMIMGDAIGIEPRVLALLVGVCASNSFLLPTHQVNALLMGPGSYRNSDYLKAGGIMTLIFIIVAVGVIDLLYL